MNDIDRAQWIDNDEGLYNLCRFSQKSKKIWIRENRVLIDEVIQNVKTGKKPASYLEYQR